MSANFIQTPARIQIRALGYQEFGFYGFMVGIIFLLILVLGMAYEWRKGDLEWARPKPNIPYLDELLVSKKTIDKSSEITEESSNNANLEQKD